MFETDTFNKETTQYDEHKTSANNEFVGSGCIGDYIVGRDEFEMNENTSIPDVIRGHGSHTSHSSK